MKHIFNKLNKIQMTDAEARHMRAYLLSNTAQNPALIRSNFGFSWYLKTASAALSMLLVTAGGITYGAQKALPGDILYSVKIHIEEVKSTNNQTPKEKLIQQQARLMTRFDEIETLVKTNSLTPEKQAVVTEQLKLHLNKIATTVTDAEKEVVQDEDKDTTIKANVTDAIATATKITNEVVSRQATITELANDKSDTTKQIIKDASVELTLKTTEIKDIVTSAAAPKKDEADAIEADLNNINITIHQPDEKTPQSATSSDKTSSPESLNRKQ